MHALPQALNLKRVLLFIAVYLILSYTAVAFKIDAKQVIIFWPASGLTIVFFVRYGLIWSIPLAIALLLMHILIYPVPLIFLPFSIVSNVVGFSIAAYYLRNQKPTSFLSISNIFALLRASALMAITSGIIGAFGLAFSGISNYSEWGQNVAIWSLSNLLGILCICPILFLLTAPPSKNPEHLLYDRYGSTHEKIIWCLLLCASYPFIFFSSLNGTVYTLALAFFPIALLVWSAIRFQPAWTFCGLTITMLIVSTITGLGFAGFTQPSSSGDIILLLFFLCFLSLFPVILQASSHENRVAVRVIIRRATTDLDTGLPNRIAFEDDARQTIQTIGPVQTLAYLDFDHFTVINDATSHKAGDVLIKAIASMLKASLQAGDRIYRIGGDEFAFLFASAGRDAELRAQRILRNIESFKSSWNGSVLSTTASIGLANLIPGKSNYSQILSQADAACFTAKELGGNRLCIAEQDSAAFQERTDAMQLAVKIRAALAQSCFELDCQTIQDLSDNTSNGKYFEVLLRMRDPQTGERIPPGMFIPAAERFHLGTKIDRHVVEMVLNWMESNPDSAKTVSACAINLSAASMEDESFAEFLSARFKKSSFPASKLIFEITETSAMHDLSRAQNLIRNLRNMGCRFALDDFGSGFCSFSYLQKLDVDIFKIDGSFVRNLETSQLSQAVVHSITEIAAVLNKITVAEHCENTATAELLRTLGVHQVQGFGIHRPQPIAEYFAR